MFLFVYPKFEIIFAALLRLGAFAQLATYPNVGRLDSEASEHMFLIPPKRRGWRQKKKIEMLKILVP